MTKFKSIDGWVLMAICATLITAYLYPAMTPVVNQDSYQYLSVADNALHGRIGYTSIIHFDTERSFGRMPAPLVTFPAGYGLALALVSRLGMSIQAAGFAISLIATLACIPLLMWIGARAGFSRALRYFICGLFVTNATVIVFGASVMTEALFMMLNLLGIAFIVQAKIRNADGIGWYWVAAGLCFAAAYFARYAGMFFVVGLVFLVAYYAAVAKWDLLKGHLIVLCISAAAVIAAMARNIYLVDNWRGGNDKVVNNPLLQTIGKALQGTNVLLLGPGSGSPGGTTILRLMCILLFVAGMALLFLHHRRSTPRRDANQSGQRTPIATEVAFLTVFYMSCLFYAGLKSVIDYGDPRYFLPVAPLFFLLIGVGIMRWAAIDPAGHSVSIRTGGLAALAMSAVVCMGLNLLLLRLPSDHGISPLEMDFTTSRVGNEVFSTKVASLLGKDGIIVSNNGQNVAHVVGRPTISLVGPTFSSVEWNETAIRDAAAKFHAKAIVIYVPEGEQWRDDNYIPSSFVRQLAESKPAQWMKLELQSKHLLVYVPSSGTDWIDAQ